MKTQKPTVQDIFPHITQKPAPIFTEEDVEVAFYMGKDGEYSGLEELHQSKEAFARGEKFQKAIDMNDELIGAIKRTIAKLCDIPSGDSKSMKVKMDIANDLEKLLKQAEQK